MLHSSDTDRCSRAFAAGGFIQLALALAVELFSAYPRNYAFEILDQQAHTSLLSFLLGTYNGRLGDKIGPKRRVWVVGATFGQALILMAAALCALYLEESLLAR